MQRIHFLTRFRRACVILALGALVAQAALTASARPPHTLDTPHPLDTPHTPHTPHTSDTPDTPDTPDKPPPARAIPILVYHRFAATAKDAMTVRTATFEGHLRTIAQAGFEVVPLAAALAWYAGDDAAVPAHAVAICVDDGHRSVHDVLQPLLRARTTPLPVTLFIYPSAISNASYAMTWDQLRALRQDGAYAIESHTYWHPNFHTERAHRDAAGYRAFVLAQLEKARARIHAETGSPATLLAWPFGIHDRQLEAFAAEAGHTAAFTLDARPLTRAAPVMALPRYLITDACGDACMQQILHRAERNDD